jgi:predicted Rossmann fold flavoprotein
MADFDIIILGAGAAGLMCAGVAVQRGRRVLLLERAARPGEKIRISGGGHANFTNLHATSANYLSDNPRFCISALRRYGPLDFVALVDRHGIAWHERDHGQLFCDGSARQITDMLLAEAAGAILRTGVSVTRVARCDDGFDGYAVETDAGIDRASSLVVATGGPSIPKMGASGFAWEIARRFGLAVIEPRAGLVPFTFDREVLATFAGLAGLSVDVAVAHGRTRFSEALLFTHRGLSGPAILQISSYWRPGDAIVVDLLPDTDLFDLMRHMRGGQPRRETAALLAQMLPRRLAQRLVAWADCDGRLAELSDRALRRLAQQVNAWRVVPGGTEGYRTAEVTVGGVDTRQLSSQTMEVRDRPGLYFIGEAVDVTGHLGGFNFQWAWASAQACGAVA